MMVYLFVEKWDCDPAQVLIVDDDQNLVKTLSDILRTRGVECVAAPDGAGALDRLKERDFSLVLLDLVLPDMSGIEVLARIKKMHPLTQVIILTGNATLDFAIESINKGAFSFLRKPYDIEDLILHARRAIERRRTEEKIVRQNIELQKMNEELEALSSLDPLTGLSNRRSMQVVLQECFESATKKGERISALMIDIDHFKNFNDRWGHIEADGLLLRVADILLREVRSTDYVFRYGGDEFFIILPGTDQDSASGIADRLRSRLSAEAGITISVGVASSNSHMKNRRELLIAADNALFRAKEMGRNRVEIDFSAHFGSNYG